MIRQTLMIGLLLSALPIRGEDVQFARDIAPLLADRCLRCHGPERQESGFRVDQRASLRTGGDHSEPAVVPGKPDASFLISVVSGSNSDLTMPPEGARLTPAEVDLLRRWILQGADMPAGVAAEVGEPHWSFLPVRRPEIAVGGDFPVDALIRRELARHGLSPSAPAPRRTLIRRLYLVMHGLPPTPEQTREFLNDDQPGAWERLVDRVLASPRYGERWGRHWLDIVRFGETHGFETNRERPGAWPYRDWVVDSFNSDRPWDDFVRQQIAGDALGEPVGTGFLVAGPYDLVKGQDKTLGLIQRQDELADMINATGTAFLGLTVACARCHNHKFDPITQTDYYAVQAVLAGVQHGERELPVTADGDAARQAIAADIDKVRRKLAECVEPTRTRWTLVDDDDQWQPGAAVGCQQLQPRRGVGQHPEGTGSGCRDDDGDRDRSPNIAGGQYSWFDVPAAADVVAWHPALVGQYRIWLSWGCGVKTHGQDVRYLLDRDGDLSTRGDQVLLATVDQRRDAGGREAEPRAWSGLRSGGVHELNASSVVLLRAGSRDAAVTADAVVFERSASARGGAGAWPGRPVNARRNVELPAPVEARRIRFAVLDTSSAEPCVDELEVFSGDVNVALATAGTVARSSGDLPGYARHRLEHIHDGRFGNDHSWISSESGGGWVELELPRPTRIDRIVWARDRTGRYTDRLATAYRIEVQDDGPWRLIASSDDHAVSRAAADVRYDVALASDPSAAAKLLSRLESLTAQQRQRMASHRVYAGVFREPPPTHRLYRGEPTAEREVVLPNTIRSLGDLRLPPGASEQARRVAFARWIADRENPLTARVAANRVWQFHFGTGLVDTPSDFGRNGAKPTHPELLDWLAAELMDNGWSVKHLHRVLLRSATWRQSSLPNAGAVEVDADSRLLWRFPPRRLEAEAIRDSILAVAGVLDLRMGGPGFSGFQVQLENVRHYFPKSEYGPADFRRMVYMTRVRQEQESVFGVFDCPDGSQVQPRRSRSTTPLQALNLLNSPFTSQLSRLFAVRLQALSADRATQVRSAFELCANRPPREEELRASLDFIAQEGLEQFCRAMLNWNEFLFVP